jgi:hypothetical protein
MKDVDEYNKEIDKMPLDYYSPQRTAGRKYNPKVGFLKTARKKPYRMAKTRHGGKKSRRVR